MSFIDDFAKGAAVVGGAILGGPVGAAVVGGAIASGAAEKVAKVTTKFIVGVGEVTVSAGTLILDAVADAGKAFVELVGDLSGAIALRPLRPSELAIARTIFRNHCLPLNRIVVCSLNGWGQRPFTMPGGMISTLGWSIPGIGPLLAVSSILGNLTDKYILFLGRDGYRNANWLRQPGDIPGQTLIHELTHAWQGHHKPFAWSYIFGSLMAQAKKGRDAYKYSYGLQFRDYNPEQQAHIVEDFFVQSKGGLNWGATNRPYMICNILPGKPDADTALPKESSPSVLIAAAEGYEAQARAMLMQSQGNPMGAILVQQAQTLQAAANALRAQAKKLGTIWSTAVIPGAVGG